MQRHPNFARDFLTQDGRINQSDVTFCFISLITNQVGFFSSLSLMTPPSGSWQQISCSTFAFFFLPCSLHTHIDRLVDLHIVGLRADHIGENSALLWPWVVCLSLIFSDFFSIWSRTFYRCGSELPPVWGEGTDSAPDRCATKSRTGPWSGCGKAETRQ